MSALPRVIAHLDMDAFYASVELLRYPELRGLAVVIGGGSRQQPVWENDATTGEPRRVFARLRDYVGRGVITTATYEARAFGVNSAMGLMKAAKKAPDAILLPTDFDEYRKYSRLFKAAVQALAPQVEDRGIDEIYVDLTELVAARMPADDEAGPEGQGMRAAETWWSAREIACELKQAVRDATGLSCSIGTGAEQADCKDRVGARQARRPGDHYRIRRSNRALWPLPVRRLHGVGPKACGEARPAGHRDDRRARTSRPYVAGATFRQGKCGVDARCRSRPRRPRGRDVFGAEVDQP